MHSDWCIVCISIRSVRYFNPFLIITITITHALLRLFLSIFTQHWRFRIRTIGDDRWHQYLSIDVSYVSQFDRYVISSILIIIITITHTQFRLFLIVSTTIIDIASGTIGDNRCHEYIALDVPYAAQFDRYVILLHF